MAAELEPAHAWTEQCERCRPAARAMRLQLLQARERVSELEEQLSRLQLEVSVLRAQPVLMRSSPLTLGARDSRSNIGMDESVRSGTERRGVMVPYRPPTLTASASFSGRMGLPFSTVSSSASPHSRMDRMDKRITKLGNHFPLARHARTHPDDLLEGPAAVFARLISKHFWAGEGDREQKAAKAACMLQARARGWRQRARYHAAREVYAVVSGISSFVSPSSKRSVATYVITVVRAGCCWQVSVTPSRIISFSYNTSMIPVQRL
eukprot:scaffold286319_cov32-Tisochrysis_lutea.AAC.1